MSELGTCPTCNKPVSITANPCPHCGEREFYANKKVKTINLKCQECGGSGMTGFFIFKEKCENCKGVGCLIYDQMRLVDLRNGDYIEDGVRITKEDFEKN